MEGIPVTQLGFMKKIIREYLLYKDKIIKE